MATIGQLYEVLGILHGRLAKEETPWAGVNTARLQERVIKEPDRFAKAFVNFVNNDAKLIVGELKSLCIDRSTFFNPAKFFDSGWRIWRGAKEGDGLEGVEQQDTRSLAITELDLSKLRFEHCLTENESSINGEEKLTRLKARAFIRLDARIAQALLEEPGQRTLEWIRVNLGKTWFDFPGTEFRSPYGFRCILYLYWRDDVWYCRYSVLDHDWNAERSSCVLASDQPSNT